jgi:hypothetical protein
VQIDAGLLSTPETVEFPTTGGRTAFMYFYPPTNGGVQVRPAWPVRERHIATPHQLDRRVFEAAACPQADPAEKPPLLVKSHGGPTGAADAAFSLAIQYWTSRGIAVADVNYGGSVGFGTEYRQRLTNPPSWGGASPGVVR